METIDADFKTIKKAVNRPNAKLEHLNKSSGYDHAISPRDQKFVETHFADEYQELGY